MTRLARRLLPALALLLLAGCDDPSGPGPVTGPRVVIPDTVRINTMGATQSLTATVVGASGEVVWTLHGPPVVSVGPDGRLYPRENGTTRVVATVERLEGSTLTDTAVVVVRQVVAGVVLVPPRIGLYPSDTVRMQAIAYDSLRYPVRDAAFTWRSSGDAVVAVNAAGTATARAPGLAAVTATTRTFAGAATISATVETGVVSGARFTRVRSGGSRTCGLTASGEAYCWGEKGGVTLSDGTRLAGDVPTRVPGGPPLASIDVGEFHSCGLTADGAAYCWGGNLFGQLGYGDGGTETSRRDTPQPVAGGLRFTRLATGATHTCGIAAGGSAYCWGSNDQGELGSVTPTTGGHYAKLPAAVSGGLRFVEISAGERHTCGITVEGPTYCWGSNWGGKLGSDPAASGNSFAPVRVGGALVFRSIVAAGDQNCAMTAEEHVYCWGQGYFDRTPDGGSRARTRPTRVAASLDIVSLAEGNRATLDNQQSCGVARDGAAYCWKADDGAVPVRVPGGIPFVGISQGRDRSCGVSSSGRIHCWGPGGVGGMGDGRSRGSDLPVLVSAPF